MAGLNLFTSNRLEVLAENLAEVLRSPLDSALQSEIILVQSKGMERWVSMELARRHGICANDRFPFPNHFVYGIFREMFPDLPEVSPFDPGVMTWKIMGLLPSCLGRPGFESLRSYLGEGEMGLKLFQLSSRIADTFDQYLVFRPEMVLGWEKGRESDWQAVLWRELARDHERAHRAALQKSFLDTIRKGGVELKELPKRISVFGISALPPFHMRVLQGVAQLADVNLFLMNPCREYWADIVSGREMMRLTERLVKGDKVPEELPLEKGNSLLASMGSLGRDFFKMIVDLGCDEKELFIDPGEDSLLHCVQSDILNLRERPSDGKAGVSDSDNSVRIHSCHSAMREIEVLQDRLLAMFEADPTLGPRDILVMTPDIEAYAPFIQAVFSIPPNDPRWIPFSIADRGVRNESQLIDTFFKLLDLEGSRFGASQVMAILESPHVQMKFNLHEAHLELIYRWVRETGIRWGIDAASRGKLGLPEFKENTWRAGIERMLLGYAMPDQDEQLFMGILPYDRIEGGEAAILGNFVGFVERIFNWAKELGKTRILEAWSQFLSQLLDEFFVSNDDTERDLQVIRQTLHDLGGKMALSGFDQEVGIDVIKSCLRSSLEKEAYGRGFLTGGLTFCAMLPMRAIPFRVICLVGLNDDAYPRQEKSPGFDLMTRDPRAGDRSRRDDDRYLFLEAILSARETLHVSYVGQSIRDNSVIPPSVLVSELTDYIRQGFEVPGKNILDHVVTKHRLQAFSPEYFERGEKLFSYAIENLDAARSAMGDRKDPGPFISGGLPEPGEEWKTVDLNQLCGFYSNPARFLLNHRLKFYLREDAAVLDEIEPFALEGLDKYQFENDLVERSIRKRDLKEWLAVVRATGRLPQGSLGEVCYDTASVEMRPFVKKVLGLIEKGKLEPLNVDIEVGGFRLKGRVDNIYTGGLFHYRYATLKAKDRLKYWLHHLVLNRVKPESYPSQGRLIGKDGDYVYPPIEENGKFLGNLLRFYWRGLKRPLHFFPESSWAYAEAMQDGKGAEKALEKARDAWEGSEYSRGEGQDLYFKQCFGKVDPLDEEFKELAVEIFGEMIKREKEGLAEVSLDRETPAGNKK